MIEIKITEKETNSTILPKEILVHKFLIGYSMDGKPETYKVFKEIEVK